MRSSADRLDLRTPSIARSERRFDRLEHAQLDDLGSCGDRAQLGKGPARDYPVLRP